MDTQFGWHLLSSSTPKCLSFSSQIHWRKKWGSVTSHMQSLGWQIVKKGEVESSFASLKQRATTTTFLLKEVTVTSEPCNRQLFRQSRTKHIGDQHWRTSSSFCKERKLESKVRGRRERPHLLSSSSAHDSKTMFPLCIYVLQALVFFLTAAFHFGVALPLWLKTD